VQTSIIFDMSRFPSKSAPAGVLSVKAFHEKAGRSQEDSGFIVSSWLLSLTNLFSRRVGRCRHASIRTLEERILSLGACWAFSIQPVLLSD